MSEIDNVLAGRLSSPSAPTYKLLEHGGWQALVTISEDEDHDTAWAVSIRVPCEEVDISVVIGAPNETIARKIFDGMYDAERVISGTVRKAIGEAK